MTMEWFGDFWIAVAVIIGLACLATYITMGSNDDEGTF